MSSAAPPTDASVATTTDRETSDPCARIAREEAAGTPGRDAAPGPLFGHCFPAEGPVRWAYVRESFVPSASSVTGGEEMDSYSGTWALTSFDARGAKATRFVVMGDVDELLEGDAGVENYAAVVGDYAIDVLEPVVFDYDGDGAPEVIVRMSHRVHEGPWHQAAGIFTLRHGRIEPYAPAATLRFDDVSDLDDDGRPDLLTNSPYNTTAVSPGLGAEFTVTGPRFAFHALPDGTFSATDAVAVRAARNACPALPTTLVMLNDVVCARVWGASATAVEQMIRRDCRPPRSEDERMQMDSARCAAQGDIALTWASVTPPVVLAVPAATPVRAHARPSTRRGRY